MALEPSFERRFWPSSRGRRAQGDVAEALSRLRWTHQVEHVTADGLSLDMAQPGSKLAVEFDGPWHYLVDVRSGLRSLTGASLFKRRLLRKLGWKVLHLPYFEWEELGSTSARDKYLTRRLAIFDRSRCIEESMISLSLHHSSV